MVSVRRFNSKGDLEEVLRRGFVFIYVYRGSGFGCFFSGVGSKTVCIVYSCVLSCCVDSYRIRFRLRFRWLDISLC